ncbi:hypothetical protein FRC09_012226 [Ceratobasidium sp. 395]|nr:hypothetical protein FRC09_012226 [Ceratobasidium sp. 395]
MSFSLQYSRGEADKWGNAFRSLGSLQTLTLAEMEWREAANALRHLRGLSYESFHVELREIWDMDMSELNLLLEIYGYRLRRSKAWPMREPKSLLYVLIRGWVEL